jgi:hypothetical protein
MPSSTFHLNTPQHTMPQSVFEIGQHPAAASTLKSSRKPSNGFKAAQ